MQSVRVAVLLLAVTSTSLGSPLKQLLGELIAGQGGNFDRLNSGLERERNDKGNEPIKMVINKYPGDHGAKFQPPPPKSFDWRTKGVISPVKNSGELGSSVAIAAEECVESMNAIETGLLISLSAQEVQDCCTTQLADNVFECIHNIGGLCTLQTYPVLTGHCRNTSCQPAVQIQGGKPVPPKQVLEMIEALLVRPLMVLVDASQTSFELYQGGIYTDANCNKENVDHAMQVVGYGEEDGQEYWICRNSWGESWGEQGYIRISKGNDTCGIESFASYPF